MRDNLRGKQNLYFDIHLKHTMDVFLQVFENNQNLKKNEIYFMFNGISNTYLRDIVLVHKFTLKFSSINEGISFMDKQCNLIIYKKILASYWKKYELERGQEYLENKLYDVCVFASLDTKFFPFVPEFDLLDPARKSNPVVEGEKRLIENQIFLKL